MDDAQLSKESLTQVVKSWVTNDNQIRSLNKKLRELRQEKKKHNADMINVMKEFNIDNFDVKDGQIHFRKELKREALTQKKLLEILLTHPQLGEQQANYLNEFIYENRKVTEKDVIARKITKSTD